MYPHFPECRMAVKGKEAIVYHNEKPPDVLLRLFLFNHTRKSRALLTSCSLTPPYCCWGQTYNRNHWMPATAGPWKGLLHHNFRALQSAAKKIIHLWTIWEMEWFNCKQSTNVKGAIHSLAVEGAWVSYYTHKNIKCISAVNECYFSSECFISQASSMPFLSLISLSLFCNNFNAFLFNRNIILVYITHLVYPDRFFFLLSTRFSPYSEACMLAMELLEVTFFFSLAALLCPFVLFLMSCMVVIAL